MALDVDSKSFLDHPAMLTTHPERVWSLEDYSPDIFKAAIKKKLITCGLYDLLSNQVSIQKEISFGTFGPFIRPERHARALYLDLDLATQGQHAGAIAIKGSEPCAVNFEASLNRLIEDSSVWELETGVLAGVSTSVQVMMDRLHLFLVGEGKVPGVVQLDECKEDAIQALSFHEKHLKAFGEIAHVPLPLFVFRWPDETATKAKAILRELVSPTVTSELQRLDNGIGVYVYYYPVVPYRMAHLDLPVIFGKTTYDHRKEAILKQVPAPDKLIESWFDVVSRMITLGYTATDPCSWNRGHCLMPQNLVLDGGICDINSLRQLSTFSRESQQRHSLFETVRWLDASVRFFLFGENAISARFNRHSTHTYAITLQNLQGRLRQFQKNGVKLDPIVDRILFDKSSLTEQFEQHLRALSMQSKSF